MKEYHQHHQSFPLLEKHRASTASLHLLLSLTRVLASSYVRLECLSSLCKLLLQVCLGRPLFLFPCGFHSSACLVILLGSFRRVWPTHRHFRRLIWTSIGCWFALAHRLAFGTLSNHLRCRICRRHPLTKVWIFSELVLMDNDTALLKPFQLLK